MSIAREFLYRSLLARTKEQNYLHKLERIRNIIPSIEDQYSNIDLNDAYMELKVRLQHVFQTEIALKAFDYIKDKETKPMIVDIGDSSGNHYKYFKELLSEHNFDWLSINLDEKAIEKISNKNIPAKLCRAEELINEGIKADLAFSFETLEHLFNPIQFLRDIALSKSVEYFCITVPYLTESRVGLQHLKAKNYDDKVYAENIHIFELSKQDWKLLFEFSGWEVLEDFIYLQYPKSGLFRITQPFWKKWDFEGFYGVILKRNLNKSNLYQSW